MNAEHIAMQEKILALLEKSNNSDPRFKDDNDFFAIFATMAVRFASDMSQLVSEINMMSRGITALVDLKSLEYQNGSIIYLGARKDALKQFANDIRDRIEKDRSFGANTKGFLDVFDNHVNNELDERYGKINGQEEINRKETLSSKEGIEKATSNDGI